jgi:carboxymethylenebutenolidase
MITTDTVRFGDGFSGFVAYPTRATTPLPGVIVIQEALGLNEHIEDVAGRLARAGYLALAPDCFARHGVRPAPLARERLAETVACFDQLPRPKLMDPVARDEAFAAAGPEAAARMRESALAMFKAAGDPAGNLPPVVAAARYLRDELELPRGQPIASIGFCMGGALSARLAAADPALAAAVMFYGLAPPDDVAVQIRCPVLAFYGERDPGINASLPAFAAAVTAPFEHHVFEGAMHAFFNDTRSTYDVRAARAAWARTLAFLAANLAP